MKKSDPWKYPEVVCGNCGFRQDTTEQTQKSKWRFDNNLALCPKCAERVKP